MSNENEIKRFKLCKYMLKKYSSLLKEVASSYEDELYDNDILRCTWHLLENSMDWLDSNDSCEKLVTVLKYYEGVIPEMVKEIEDILRAE